MRNLRNRDVQNPGQKVDSPHPGQVSITDSEYHYPESTNPYENRLRALGGFVFCNNNAENHRSNWRALTGVTSEHKLHVEIGCNAGHVIVEWAEQNPKAIFVGIDWKHKQLFRAAEKARKRGLKNIIFLRAHAARLPFIFGPEEIDHLHIFFPDPWPKRSQWKNRLITAKWLAQVALLVRPGGSCEIKTDHPGYFEWIEKACAETNATWQITKYSKNLYQHHPNPTALKPPEITLFEKIFIANGLPINYLYLTLNSRPRHTA